MNGLNFNISSNTSDFSDLLKQLIFSKTEINFTPTHCQYFSYSIAPDNIQKAKEAIGLIVKNFQLIYEETEIELNKEGDKIYLGDSIVLHTRISHTYFSFTIGSNLVEKCSELTTLIQKQLAPLSQTTDKESTEVQFTALNGNGTLSKTNMLFKFEDWQTIRPNYCKDIQVYMDSIINHPIDTNMGKLIIVWGQNGTGKSTAISSFLHKNKDTHKLYYISDPLNFFRGMSYYLELVEDEDKPIIFVFEDCGQLLLKENRVTLSTEMSKLLNLTSGLVGKGRNDLYIFSFNEDIESIDPAIQRPGRCHSIVNFRLLNKEEAETWLKAHNVEYDFSTTSKKAWSLAELYALKNGYNFNFNQPISKKEKIKMG